MTMAARERSGTIGQITKKDAEGRFSWHLKSDRSSVSIFVTLQVQKQIWMEMDLGVSVACNTY